MMADLEALLGLNLFAFIGLTIILAGGCAFMMGQALARTWRPWWQALPYGLLLAVADRFLAFALFGGRLLDGSGFVIAALLLLGFALLGYRVTQVDCMVTQYPWAFRRAGFFGWQAIGSGKE